MPQAWKALTWRGGEVVGGLGWWLVVGGSSVTRVVSGRERES
jgi:hypothetical protein